MGGIILALLGKSASGKDSILRIMTEKYGFTKIVPTTTRPMRPGEVDGVDYHFLSVPDFLARREAGEFAETREYHTLYDGKADVWYYGTERRSIGDCGDFAAIVDIKALKALRAEYGNRLLAVYLDVPENIRRSRCERRGDFSLPEWERRERDDEVKFAPSEIAENIDAVLKNESLDETVRELLEFVRETGDADSGTRVRGRGLHLFEKRCTKNFS